jgi:hypothetical protein
VRAEQPVKSRVCKEVISWKTSGKEETAVFGRLRVMREVMELLMGREARRALESILTEVREDRLSKSPGWKVSGAKSLYRRSRVLRETKLAMDGSEVTRGFEIMVISVRLVSPESEEGMPAE